MKIGIIGYGHVGKAMHKCFTNAVIYDEPLNIGSREETNQCELAFICVPTPQGKNGKCDTSIVEEVIQWLEVETIVIRSTVYVGFTDYIAKKYNKKIIFQPEYYGETVAHPFADIKNQNWLSFGGSKNSIKKAIKAYKTIVNSNVKFHMSDASTAEMAKYMENAFFATKVTFCNEFFDICEKLDIDYNEVRELWLADPRIGSSHTFVYDDNRGFDGKCLPKDLSAIIELADTHNTNPILLKSVQSANKKYRK